jgi:hypothetical protein
MKFEKAFCKELNDYITPYEAHDLYFDENSEFYLKRLTFTCPGEECRIPLTPVAIYIPENTQIKKHFRTKVNHKHHKDCNYFNKPPGTKLVETWDPDSKPKPKSKPEHRPTSGPMTEPAPPPPLPDEPTIRRTSYFEKIIDGFENTEEEVLKNHPLTIGSKTKKYFYFFKKIEYYEDEKGLIYFGKVKNLKKYGKNYRIDFTRWAWIDKKRVPISIYLEYDLIKKYNKKDQFLKILEFLTDFKGDIMCYFFGAYPEMKYIENGNKSFHALNVEIKNLDHIIFEFDKEAED